MTVLNGEGEQMKSDKFVAYYCAEHEFETFETFDLAKKWLDEKYKHDGPEGFAEESVNGGDFIATITHRSKYEIDEFKKDYENEEDWPYDSDFDSVGHIKLV
jgi:hypothetical protein